MMRVQTRQNIRAELKVHANSEKPKTCCYHVSAGKPHMHMFMVGGWSLAVHQLLVFWEISSTMRLNIQLCLK